MLAEVELDGDSDGLLEELGEIDVELDGLTELDGETELEGDIEREALADGEIDALADELGDSEGEALI